ncbi:META domain-containing protein [Kribbella sp. NBC_00662]|uniref:META domain-containing protein n=1 Tax=Kribbella sp. NBC_00662 TaxID=2975969 RepID=UPI003248E6F3
MAAPIGKTYLSTAVTDNGVPKQLVPGTRIRLEFARVPNQNAEGPEVYDVLRVHAGCNRLGAHSAAGTLLADGRLFVAGFGSTAKGCEPARRAQDEWLQLFLTSNPTWQLDGDELTLTSAGTTITLLDRKIAEPDLPLDGVRWKLATTITNGDLFHHRHRAAEAWLTFNTDHLTGWTGCNELSGTVTRTNTELIFSGVSVTEHVCTGETAEVEAAILATLGTTASYTIDYNRLILINPAGVGLDLKSDG